MALRRNKGDVFFDEFVHFSWNVKVWFLFFTGSQADLSHVQRKGHECGFDLSFSLPAELSLPDSRNKRLVHQGSPCPKHFYHRNPFPFRICTTLVLASLIYSPSPSVCWSVLSPFFLSAYTLSSSAALRERNKGPRDQESFIITRRVSLPDTTFQGSSHIRSQIFQLRFC